MRTSSLRGVRARHPALAAAAVGTLLLLGLTPGPNAAGAATVDPSSSATAHPHLTTEHTWTLAVPRKRIATTRWGVRLLHRGTFAHTRLRSGGIEIGRRPALVTYRDPYGSTGRLAYQRGVWFSPWVEAD